jgi:SNW domain-containing protein 1
MVNERLAVKEMQAKEEMLRKVAQETREKRAGGNPVNERSNLSSREAKDKAERDKIREDRKRDRERERRREAMGSKKSKLTRDDNRDISEKIALGELPGLLYLQLISTDVIPVASAAKSSEALYDQRLFNQSQGMDSGFGTEESYNIYDKPLFSGTNNGQLYHHKKNEEEEEQISESTMKRILDTTKFRPDKGFQGAERGSEGGASRGAAPVEFEKRDEDEADPFGLEELLSQAKTGAKKKA